MPCALLVCVLALAAMPAFAQGKALEPDAEIEIAPEPETAPAPRDTGGADAESPSPGEAPPPLHPRHRGLVLESTLGVLGFAGQFRHLAPPASWMHTELGYELLSWLMLFGEAELAFTNTGEAVDASHARAFPMWGFGGGARAELRAGTFGAFVQGSVGALTAFVPHDALTYLGFRGAESLGVQFGGRLGVEWYPRDRHLAVTLQGGGRVAQGFAKLESSADLPLMWDTGLGLRYSF